jgi:hypothetical protein
MSLKRRRPSLSNARSSGAGKFLSKTCGPDAAGVAGHAANPERLMLALALGVGDGVGVAC